MRKFSLALAACAIVWLAAAPAHATFHIMVIDEVFPGFAGAPDAQYVTMLTQLAAQTLVHGQPVPTFDTTGTAAPPFATFCSSSPTSKCDLPAVSPACKNVQPACPTALQSANRRILVATQRAQDLFCITADLVATGSVPYPNGRVCWGDCDLRNDCGTGPVDCVAYGAFPMADNGIFGMPAPSPPPGGALVGSPDRVNQFLAGGHLLDSAMGFSVQPGTPLLPAPQNFHGDVGGAGLAGDPEGTGVLEADDVGAEARILFQASRRCDLPAQQRGADANFDTRVSAADVVATIKIVSTQNPSL